jgi:hypothetical protein
MNIPRLIVAALCLFAAMLRASQPWDVAFHANTGLILDAASHMPPSDEQDIFVLLEDHRYTIHADGRMDATIRKVYRIEQQDAVEEWSSIEQPYQPWYQQPPDLKARVIGKDGTVRWLDLKTIVDAPSRQFDASIFSDQRVIRAPLPGVAAGSIVEFEIAIHDKLPLLDAGVVHRVTVPPGIPFERFHILIDAEPGVNLSTASQLIPGGAQRRSTIGKATRIECELGPLKKATHFEWNLPSDTANSPYLAFSTGASWQAIAARYESIVNERIQNADLKSMLDGIDIKAPPADVAAALAARLHKNVRYTGVEFAEAAIVPGTPAETLKRGYGDCKDKATLLVAMLRAAGLKADVALLDSGTGLDVDKDLPGMGMFDHAIVYVASNPPLWIDATASETRIGFLPNADAGRLALIANRTSAGLVKTPEAESKRCRQESRAEIFMSELGLATVRQTLTVDGCSFESLARGAYGSDEKKSKEQLESLAKKSFAAKSMGKYESMRKDDMSGPFRMSLEAINSRIAPTTLNEAVVALAPWLLFQNLPYALMSNDLDEDSKDTKPRQHDFIVTEPYQIKLQFVIHPPALFKAVKLPDSADSKLGPATFSKHFETKPDGTIEVEYRFDSGKPRLTASEFVAFQAALKDHGARTPELISLSSETSEYVAIGQTSKAISILRERLSEKPDNAMLHVRLSNVLLSAGLGDVSRQEARKSVELNPKSAYGWDNLGVTLEHDSYGRLRRGDWNPAEAEKAIRKAIELDPENEARFELPILLEHTPQGQRYGTGARMDEAISLYREIVKKPDHLPQLDQNLAIALIWAGKLDEAKEAAKKITDEPKNLLLDTIAAIQETPARVIVRSQSAYPDSKQRAYYLGAISQTLAQLRYYEAAATMMNAAARLLSGLDLQARAELLGRLKRWQNNLLPEHEAGSPIQHVLLEAVRGTLSSHSVAPYLSKRITKQRAEELVRAIQANAAKVRVGLASIGLDDEALVDYVVSLVDLEKEGDDTHGYSFKVLSPGTGSTLSVYVVAEDGKFRILGLAPAGFEVGGLILELLDHKDLKGAQWWLDRAVKDSEAREDGTGRPAVVGLWSGVGDIARGPAAIRAAVAALQGASTGSPVALATLEQAKLKAVTALEKSQFDEAICDTLRDAKRWADLMVAAKRLETSKILHEEGFRYFIEAATNLGKWKELEMEANSAFISNQKHVVAMRALALARLRQGDAPGALEWGKRISKVEYAGADELIFAAWVALANGKADKAALESLKKSNPYSRSDTEYVLTVAMLEATLGLTDDAQASLSKALAGARFESIPAMAWAVHGKICAQYGFSDCAKTSLLAARQQAEVSRDDKSEWLLAALER